MAHASPGPDGRCDPPDDGLFATAWGVMGADGPQMACCRTGEGRPHPEGCGLPSPGGSRSAREGRAPSTPGSPEALVDLLPDVLPGPTTRVGAPQLGLDLGEVAARVALVVARLVPAPIVRLGVGEGARVGLAPQRPAPRVEVPLEGRAVAAPVLVDVDPLLADGVADGPALGLDVAVDHDLAGDDGLLAGDRLLAAHGDADGALLEGGVQLAGGHGAVGHVDAVDGDLLAAQLDRDVHPLGGDLLADVDRAQLALALLDRQALLADRDADLLVAVGVIEVAAAFGPEVEAILVHALERAEGDPPLAHVGVLVIVAVDGAVVAIVGVEDVQPLAKLALEVHDRSFRPRDRRGRRALGADGRADRRGWPLLRTSPPPPSERGDGVPARAPRGRSSGGS